MTIALLDINDSNLQVWRAQDHIQSPAYALLENNRYIFGNDARAAARLAPRQINTRYWWQLNTQALQPALGPARHTADLVHAHLLDLHKASGEPEEFLLAVSSSLQRDQLALLLGIIQQCPFSAVGLVNRSVALASVSAGTGKIFHLELQLHQALLTELDQTDGQVAFVRSVPLPGCGMLQLQERLVETIAAAFIRQTRFDPRRKAQSEQLLYDALPTALRDLAARSETNLEISGYRARIVSSDLAAAGERLAQGATNAIGTLSARDTILLDPLLQLLPGIHMQLPPFSVIAQDTLPSALLHHMDTLVQRSSEALNFITALPMVGSTAAGQVQPQVVAAETAAPTTATSPATTAATPSHTLPEEAATESSPKADVLPPTHILHGATATAIHPGGETLEPGLTLTRAHGNWILQGEQAATVRINSAPYQAGTALAAGDAIVTRTGAQYTLIVVTA